MITGFVGLELSMADIIFSSVSKLSYPVGAITIFSPTYQSTAVLRVIVDSPAFAVVRSSVQVGLLVTPCISKTPYLTPITLLP